MQEKLLRGEFVSSSRWVSNLHHGVRVSGLRQVALSSGAFGLI